ncbi:MAG: hypothetical protein LQ341_002718 [Variospora aurantia]|nr:MAG: hypothetical protein LQ341_002718 [Variospora aurantia]
MASPKIFSVEENKLEEKLRFPEYQQRVRDLRRKHGVEGDVTVLEDLNQQKKQLPLEDWVEYQYIIFQRLEISEKKKQGGRDMKGWLKKIISGTTVAQKELDLAKKKLETTQSDRMAGTVARSVWIGLFLDEVEAARVCLNEIRKDKIPSPGPKGLREANKECLEWAKWHRAEVEASSKERFAEKALRAAQSDDFGETVERAALIKSLLKDVELAQTCLDEAIASQQRSMLETARIKGDVLGALCLVVEKKRDLERHKILVEWVERQRRARAFDCATSAQNTKNHVDQTMNQKPNQRLLRNHSGQASRPANRKDKSSRRQKKKPLSSEQSAQAASINPSVYYTKSKQTSMTKQHTTPAPLRPIHSSKVAKSNRRQPTGQQAKGMKELRTADQLKNIREIIPRAAPPRSTGQKPRRKLVGVPTRTSTRISKKPERFGAPRS